MKIRVNNSDFLFFNNFAISKTFDSVASSFSFIARFNPDNPQHRELFRPLGFQRIEVFSDDDVLELTGKIVRHDFNSTSNPELVKISGYSLAGELEDCNIPSSLYPLESNNRNLREITEKLLRPFNIGLIVNDNVSNEVNLNYTKSIAEPTESIKSYISKLTAQRNIVLSHDNRGNIVFTRPNIQGAPVLSLNTENTIKMSLSVNGQALHSEITVLRQPSRENNNLSPADTIQNNNVSSFRPKVKTLSSGTDTDTRRAADNELASELQNITILVELPRRENVEPGDIIEIENRGIFLFNKTRTIVKSVGISENESKTTTTLNLVLPESYTGGQPANIFL